MKPSIFFTILLAGFALMGMAQERSYPPPAPMTPEMTEFWESQPEIVTPADMDRIIPPPSDALVLFDGNGFDEWTHSNGSPVAWDLVDGNAMQIKPKSGGSIQTKRSFQDFQLHVEWSAPAVIKGESQLRGNSGVILQGRYEVQILDSHENETYANGQAASIYKQYPPLVNATQKPGRWNTYDIIFTAPRFNEDGSLHSHAYITVLHNGVLVQNHSLVYGPTEYIGLPIYKAHGPGPIVLQDHGDLVRFRNVWIREL